MYCMINIDFDYHYKLTMKTYSIIITVVAVAALASSAYFGSRYGGLSAEVAGCQSAKADTEQRLSDAQAQLTRVNATSAVIKGALESFMIPGDLKALTVGSEEAAAVEKNIAGVADSKDRMMMEKNWKDFKSSRLLNSLLGLLRDASNNIERTLAPKQ